MEDNNRFVFFSGLVIGLKSKDYQNQEKLKILYHSKVSMLESLFLIIDF